MIFGKNSDRSPNEPNLTLFYPKAEHHEKTVQCTYIAIDQVPVTNALLLVAPSWMWGGEMGINDHGVAIGNEAVFTRTHGKKTERLIGMDLVRLGLERGHSALEACDMIISLLERYGQGGNCGFDKPFYYDNSFLIADKDEAFILETAGKAWALQRCGNSDNISNRLSLHGNYLKTSASITDFASRYSDFLYTHFSGSKIRMEEAAGELEKKDFDLGMMMKTLRHHYSADENRLFPKGSVRSICMHKSALGDHTTNSLIFEIDQGHPYIWLTGCSTPCLSVYKPVCFSDFTLPVTKSKESCLQYWLDREYLIRAVYAGLIEKDSYQKEIYRLQEAFLAKSHALRLSKANDSIYRAFSETCCHKEQELVERYRDAMEKIKASPSLLPKRWQYYTKRLGLSVFDRDYHKHF